MRVLKERGIEISLEVIGLEKIEQKIYEMNAHLERAKELAEELAKR